MLGLSELQSLFTGSTTRRSRRRRIEGGAQARSHPVCVASQPKQRGTQSRVAWVGWLLTLQVTYATGTRRPLHEPLVSVGSGSRNRAGRQAKPCNAVTEDNTHSKQARTAHLRGANVQRTPSQLNRALLKIGQDIYGADLTSRRVLLAVIGAE